MDRRTYRCGYCNELLGNFDEETLSLCMIALETFIHREPTMAAPLLFRIINTITRLKQFFFFFLIRRNRIENYLKFMINYNIICNNLD